MVFMGGVAGLVASHFLAGSESEWRLLAVGIILLLAAAVYARVALRTVSAMKIDGDFVWLDGVSLKFVSLFPPPPKGYWFPTEH